MTDTATMDKIEERAELTADESALLDAAIVVAATIKDDEGSLTICDNRMIDGRMRSITLVIEHDEPV